MGGSLFFNIRWSSRTREARVYSWQRKDNEAPKSACKTLGFCINKVSFLSFPVSTEQILWMKYLYEQRAVTAHVPRNLSTFVFEEDLNFRSHNWKKHNSLEVKSFFEHIPLFSVHNRGTLSRCPLSAFNGARAYSNSAEAYASCGRCPLVLACTAKSHRCLPWHAIKKAACVVS